MFKRAGLDYTWAEIKQYADADPKWYLSKTWTVAEENSFRRWLTNHFMHDKAFKIYRKSTRKKLAEREVRYFLFMYGWRLPQTKGLEK